MNRFAASLIVLALLAGCAPPSSRQASFSQVQHTVSQRIGRDVRWNSLSPGSTELDNAVREMLAAELNADQAVQIALLTNRNLQATFEELGIAHADLVQAGLLKNPVFDIGIRFPDRRPSKTYLDFSVAESFLDVLWIPARKRIAAAQFEQTRAKVTHEVLSLAADTRSAFYAYQGAAQLVEMRRGIADALNASADAAQKLHDAGNITDLELLSQKSQAARAKIDLMSAQADADAAKEKVAGLMGLVAGFTAAPKLPDLPKEEGDVRGLESLAIQQRADVTAARADVIAQGRVAGLVDQTRFFSSADIGVEAERETEGQWRIGPRISIPLPIFDQGQAAVARARAALRQSQEHYAALVIEIGSQVRAARTRMLAGRSKAIYYRDELLPMQQKVTEQMQLQYNGMFVGVFQLLQAKRDQIDTGREYIESLRDYWMARCDLERAIGSALPPTKGDSK